MVRVPHKMTINIFRRLGRRRDPSDYVSSVNQLVARERVDGRTKYSRILGRRANRSFGQNRVNSICQAPDAERDRRAHRNAYL